VKYIYCLASPVASSAALPRGLGGKQVQPISFRSISALVSDMAAAQLVGNASHALEHQAVVQAAVQLSSAVMPCRFGTLLADEAQLLALLRQHYAACEAELARLRDKLEVGVQAIFSGSQVAPGPALGAMGLTAGTQYLLAKRRQSEASRAWRDNAEDFAQTLNVATTPLWTEVKAQKRPLQQGLLLSLCYLVQRDQVSAFRHIYEQVRLRSPQLKLLYTGPWPPYSFTALDLSPGGGKRCAS
jgi:hypothetical protein